MAQVPQSPKRKITKAEKRAGRFALALHKSGQGGLTTNACDRMCGGHAQFRAAKEFAQDHGFVFWQWDARERRYFFPWVVAQEGAIQTWKGMRTRMRRQAMRHRSAIQAKTFHVPSPGVPFKAMGPTISAIYDGLVALGVLYWVASTGSENNVPLGDIHQEASAVMTQVFTPAA